MSKLQKVVVLCLILGLGVLIGFQLLKVDVGNNKVVNNSDDFSGELEKDSGITEPELELPKELNPTPTPETQPETVACTMDAKQCPDGSYVGRIGPDCEFATCPSAKEIICTDEQKQAEACTMEYAPVCGLVQVQCFTTPCDPIPETFGNACSACAQGNVVSYTEGECEA